MSLADYGAEGVPVLRRPADADLDGLTCPACDTPLDDIETDLLPVHREHLVHETTSSLLERAGIKKVHTRGRVCPLDETLFPATVDTPWALGWSGYVGVRCRFGATDGVHAVPCRLEDFGPLAPLLESTINRTQPEETKL